MRTSPCDSGTRAGRRQKMTQFAAAADFILDFADEVGDAYVTLCVHAGIAAADVICCTRLGEIAQGENHNEAVQLLTRADPSSAKYLQTLLGMKTRAGYSAAR